MEFPVLFFVGRAATGHKLVHINDMGLVPTLVTTLRDVIHNWLASACTTPWVVGL